MIFHCHCMGHVYIASWTLITPFSVRFLSILNFLCSAGDWKSFLKKFKEPSLESSSLTHPQLPGSRLCKRRKVDSGSAAQHSSFFCSIRINRRKYTQLCHALNFSLARSFISINFVDMERSRWIHLGIEKLDWNWIEKRECLTMIRQIFPCVLCNSFVRLQLFYGHS